MISRFSGLQSNRVLRSLGGILFLSSFGLFLAWATISGQAQGEPGPNDLFEPFPIEANEANPGILAYILGKGPNNKLAIQVVVMTSPGEIKESGPLKIALLNESGQSLSKGEIPFKTQNFAQNQTLKFFGSQPPKVIRVEGPGGFRREVEFARAKIVKPLEVSVTLPRELANGSEFDFRLVARAVQSFTRTFGIAGTQVKLELTKTTGKSWHLGTFLTDQDGILHQRVRIPEMEDGEYQLELRVENSLSGETIKRSVKIKRDPKILLTTDKPLYQPGQEIHMRALVLSAFDLKPAAKASCEFEVEDGKSNKVFKKTVTTSEQGIASADFVLASEVNQGSYRLRVTTQGKKSEKMVLVEPYVLPRFKLALKGDKSFYLPKETIKGSIQADYVFGKPLAGAKIKIRASTMDVAEKVFQNWEGKTDNNGLATFEIPLPDYLVGLPVAKGDAVVRLEAEIIDSADHIEKTRITFPVSRSTIRVAAIPQGGYLVPGLENRIYAVVSTPDGKPVKDAEVSLEKEGRITQGKTNESGVVLLSFTPKLSDFQIAENKNEQTVPREIILGRGGAATFTNENRPREPIWSGKVVASLPSGEKSEFELQTKATPSIQGIILQTDRAVYQPGQKLSLQVLASNPTPSLYIDVIREGQTVLTDTLTMKEGKGSIELDLPTGAKGALEIHAWQNLPTGEIVRDTRVVYAQPSDEIKIKIDLNKDTYRPGETAEIQFQLSDAKGQPKPGALGVIIVDEAVFQLQETQPGLEKVFFTLQEELLKPKAQILKATEELPELIRPPVLNDDKQLVASALFAAVKTTSPEFNRIDPSAYRILEVTSQVSIIVQAMVQAVAVEKQGLGKYLSHQRGTFIFSPNFLRDLDNKNRFPPINLKNPLGGQLTLDDLMEIEPSLTPDKFAQFVTLFRMAKTHDMLTQWVDNLPGNQGPGRIRNIPDFSKYTLEDVRNNSAIQFNDFICQDIYGQKFRIKKINSKNGNQRNSGLGDWELVSAGVDGKFGTKDDLRLSEDGFDPFWGELLNRMIWGRRGGKPYFPIWEFQYPRYYGGSLYGFYGGGVPNSGVGAFRGGGLGALGGGLPRPGGGFPGAGGPGVGGSDFSVLKSHTLEKENSNGADRGPGAPPAEPIRLREYFPETLLWRPALITDDQGRASVKIPLADSITTWRLSASASTSTGALGSNEKGFRVFQDFFLEPDLPRFLTQKDELIFSITLYNYLDQPQTIRLKLQDGDWFERLGDAAEREIQLKPNQVLGVKYRIRALKNGTYPLEIEARGTRLSDRVRRQVEVLPYGQRIEKAVTGRLGGKWSEKVHLPTDAVEGASRVSVKVYPGVFSQLVEGMDGILRMPGGCFEQTTSSAYPNLLVVQYIKRNGLVTPAIQAKAEAYLNAGYQRLLTFERPGGGFDLWGRDKPVLWLSAYGLMEFSDMAKVWPVDPGVIERTKAWLLKERNRDGTWSNMGLPLVPPMERMGDSRLLMTSYVTWALLEAGAKPAEIQTSLDFLRKEVSSVEHPYILALAANALVRADSKDPASAALIDKVLSKLEGMRQRKPEWDASFMPARDGQSLTYATGNSLEVETTALAALALLESGTRALTVNELLAYLTKSKDSHGTWGSTQATILALKALVGASTTKQFKEPVEFKILVGGREAVKGRIDETNSDLLQVFDLHGFVKGSGDHEITVESNRNTAMQVQIATRYFIPWKADEKQTSSAFDLKVDYDRSRMAVGDTIKAKATLKYLGAEPTAMVMLDLGIAPGFQLDPAEFENMVQTGKLKKFSLTDRQAILYLEEVSPKKDYVFEYSLKVKYPIKGKSLPVMAWEYYTPDRRVEAKPSAFEVVEAGR